ncbi:MAG: DUF87 domain-containing protein, partial [Thermoplasmata archaeon]
DWSINFYFSGDPDIETLNTIYENIFFENVDKIDVSKFNDVFQFRPIKRKEKLKVKTKDVDLLEYILGYSIALQNASFILVIEFFNRILNPDFLSIRIVVAFKNGYVIEDLLNLIKGYIENTYWIKKKKVSGFAGYIDGNNSSLFLPYPEATLIKYGLGMKSEYQSKIKNIYGDIVIGKSLKNNVSCKLHLLKEEGQSMLIIGETGSGKSTLLISIFLNIINSGVPILFLDPTGDSVERIIGSLNPKIMEKVVYIDPVESLVSMNLLEMPNYINKDLAISRLAEDIIQMLRNVTEAESGIQGGLIGSRIEEIMRNSIYGLAEIKGSTLTDIYSIITNIEIRKYFKKISSNDEFIEFLDNLDNFTSEDISSTRRTLSFIKYNKILNKMFCSRNPKFSFYDSIREGKIILVNGERGKVGDKVSTFILSTILTMFWIYIQGRKDKGSTFIFCDEFQEYYNSSFDDMLILGRKENLNLFMVTTHLSTVSQKIKENIMANTKNYALFRLSPSDAIDFSEKFSIEKDKLIFMGKGTAYVKSMVFSDFMKIEKNFLLDKKNKEILIEKSKDYVRDKDFNVEIIFDLKLLEYLHLEKNEENLRSIYDLTSEYKNNEYIKEIIKNNYLDIKEKVFQGIEGKVIDKLLSMGNIVRIENKDPLILRCIPMIPNIYQQKFNVYINPETVNDGISIFTVKKINCNNCFTLDEFLSIDPHYKLLEDISGICLNYSGKLITTPKRISDALREYSEKYKNYKDLERVVKKTLLDSGYCEEGERIIINGERIRTININIEKMEKRFKKYNFMPSKSLKIE